MTNCWKLSPHLASLGDRHALRLEPGSAPCNYVTGGSDSLELAQLAELSFLT
jgi:hypothetical protein